VTGTEHAAVWWARAWVESQRPWNEVTVRVFAVSSGGEARIEFLVDPLVMLSLRPVARLFPARKGSHTHRWNARPLIAAFGTACMRCGVDHGHCHVDHIQPRSKGGTDDLDNLQILCAACNTVKGNREAIDYRPAGWQSVIGVTA
jgi:5-methylcytosine-specific restriction endonuclease McrA